MSLLLSAGDVVINFDQWHQQGVTPIRRVAVVASVAAAFFFVAAPAEVITVDKWVQPVSQPYQGKSNRFEGGVVGPLSTEGLDWFIQTAGPTRSKTQVTQPLETRVEVVVTNPEVVTLDKWFQPISQPYFVKWGPTGDDPLVSKDFEPAPPPPVFERPIYSKRHEWVDNKHDQLLREDDEILELLKIWVECQ